MLSSFHCVHLFETLQASRLLCLWDSPDKNTGVGFHFLLQGIFLTQGSNPQLLCLLNQQGGSTTGTTWEALYACVSGCYSKYSKYVNWLNHSSLYETSSIVLFSLVAQSCPTLCDPMDSACQASLSITNAWSLLELMSIRLVMPSNHLVLCCPLLLLPSIFPSIFCQFSMSIIAQRKK